VNENHETLSHASLALPSVTVTLSRIATEWHRSYVIPALTPTFHQIAKDNCAVMENMMRAMTRKDAPEAGAMKHPKISPESK
jgi:hypothetical protein